MFALALLATGWLACQKSAPPSGGGGGGGGTTPAATATTNSAKVDDATAKQIFNEKCANCHGFEGKGDGPGAAALNPKPRNYTNKMWQASVTDEQITKTIVYGGAAVGKSPVMPASPDLDAKPEVVAGLLKIVRGFGN
jgi:mono/diheme cytochrome c family protein